MTLLWLGRDAVAERRLIAALGTAFRIVRVENRRRLAVPTVGHFDLVLLVADSGVEDTIGACRELRARPATSSTPILLLSASSRPDDLPRAFDAGVSDYLTAPITPGQLRARALTCLLRATPIAEPDPVRLTPRARARRRARG